MTNCRVFLGALVFLRSFQVGCTRYLSPSDGPAMIREDSPGNLNLTHYLEVYQGRLPPEDQLPHALGRAHFQRIKGLPELFSNKIVKGVWLRFELKNATQATIVRYLTPLTAEIAVTKLWKELPEQGGFELVGSHGDGLKHAGRTHHDRLPYFQSAIDALSELPIAFSVASNCLNTGIITSYSIEDTI